MAKVQIEQPEKEIPKKVLAEAIVAISQDVRKLYENGLNRKAVVVLLKHSTGLTMGQIENVLDSLIDLRAMYCR